MKAELKPIAGRLPPHDLEAEAAVIASVLLKPGVIDELAGVLEPEDCYAPAHEWILRASLGLHGEGRPIDLVSVGGWLRDRERLAQVGGTPYLARIVDATRAVANVLEHALIVGRKARRRRIIAEAQTIVAEGYGDVGDEAAWIEGADGRLAAAARASEARPIVTIGDALRRVWSEIVAGDDPSAKFVGACTGLIDLDDLIGPLRPGRVTVIGGFWGDGKSALGLQCAVATVMQHAPTPAPAATSQKGPLPSAALVITVEMSDVEQAQRALFSRAAVDSGKARPAHVGEITEVEWRRLRDAASDLKDQPLFIDDRPDMTPELIRASIRRHKVAAAKHGRELRLAVVDYLQLVDAGERLRKQANREQEVATVARALKRIAKAEAVHILALAQLNDDPNKRSKDERKPTSRDFRESKAIPMNADCVILIHNPDARERAKEVSSAGRRSRTSSPDQAELIVDKLKGGRTGTVKVIFFPHLTLFADFDGRTSP